MNRKYTREKLRLEKYESGLIIDNNKSWQHPSKFTTINNYIDGDLHHFFDLVADEQLFKIIPERFDLIFIGEIFHVINLQTLIYNLEEAHHCLNKEGIISIAINQDSIKTAKTEYHKIIDRLEKLSIYKLAEKIVYVDESAKEWTMLNLRKVSQKEVSHDAVSDAIEIGHEIAELINRGKNIKKLKSGFLQSNSKLEINAFKAAYTNNLEMLDLYLQNQLISLKPRLKQQFAIDLANFIFDNRKSLLAFEDLSQLQEGCFVLAVDDYKQRTLSLEQAHIANYAELFNIIWNQSLKQKPNLQLHQAIEAIKE